MKQVAQRISWRTPETPFAVQWYMTPRCNFDCVYCMPWDPDNKWSYYHDDVSKPPTFDIMKSYVDKIIAHKGTHIEWGLGGGEPTIIKDLPKLVKYIRETNPYDLTICTNGSLPEKKILELYEDLDGMVMSLHMDYVSKNPDEYIEKLIALEEQRRPDQSLTARFIVNPKHMKLIDDMYQELMMANIHKIDFRNVKLFNGESFYSNEQIKVMESWYDEYGKQTSNIVQTFEDGSEKEVNYELITLNNQHSYTGWSCMAGIEQCNIDPLGRVSVGNCAVGGPIGNLNDDNFTFPIEPVTCTKQWCLDYCDIRTTKWKL